MSTLLGLRARIRDLLHRRASEARMDEEFRFHLEMETAQNVRRGMSRERGRRAALVAFGGMDTHREAVRDERGERWLRDVWADVRYAVRTLRRSPGLVITATFILTVGIGINGAVFGSVNGLLFRAVPGDRPDRLVALYSTDRNSGQLGALAYDDFRDFAESSRIFNGLAVHVGVPLSLRTGMTRDLVWGEMVSENYFDVLRMRPVLGRFFPRSAAPGSDPYAVLSYDGWQRRFGGADSVVGRTVRINGTPFTIMLQQNYTGWLTLVAHARGDALGVLPALRDAIAAADPALPAFGAVTMQQAVENGLSNERMAATFAGFFGIAALLISAVGLYGLVANVVAARTREIGVRLALGATPRGVIGLVMGGAGRLALLGLAIGLAGALALGRALGGLLVGLSPRDPLTFASVPVALAAVVLAASYLPARRATRLDPMKALRE